MDNLMDKSALERLQAELIQRRDKLQPLVATIGLFTPTELKALKADLQVTEYFIDQVQYELDYIECQSGTYVNPFISNNSAKAFPKSGIDAANKDSIREAIETPHSASDTDKNINLVSVIDFDTNEG